MWINELKGYAQGLFRFNVAFSIWMQRDALFDIFRWDFNVKRDHNQLTRVFILFFFSFHSQHFLHLNISITRRKKLTKLCDLYEYLHIEN